MKLQTILCGALAVPAILVVGIAGCRGAFSGTLSAAESGGAAGAPRMSAKGFFRTKGSPAKPLNTQLAGFAAGCFWGVEQEFRQQKGVVATAAGYSGGHTKNPTYEEVCSHTTGHAETVMIEYDPKVITYPKLLKLFWDLHDPTTLNRQGPDEGDQYRSAIFYFTPEQKAAAIASRDQLQKSGELTDPIVTQIVPSATFTKAEEYHQQYVEKGGVAYCNRRK